MGNISYMKFKGSKNLRLRLLLSTLLSTPILIEDIYELMLHGLVYAPSRYPSSVSLKKFAMIASLRSRKLAISTKLKYKPGIVMGKKYLVHDCGVNCSIGYFLEPLIVLGLFGKKSLAIRLRRISNDSEDPSVGTFRSTTLHILKPLPAGGGGGDVLLSLPIVQDRLKRKILQAITWTDEGMVKRIRGVYFLNSSFCFSLKTP
ncbi:hypothetical protein M9H77_15460 [Catharanthus roseus]|uniref:Uncharacterized protein n=1 Tax=Catharanthus roseus TaxID=4058 RepID=A0ACC0AX65_CATRO|nr:hypothetical protein M9H77_15460 [Catharanthus roseus]